MPRFVSGKKRAENIESDGESIEQQETRLEKEYKNAFNHVKTNQDEARRGFEKILEDRAYRDRDVLQNPRCGTLKKIRGLTLKQLSELAAKSGDKDAALRLLGQAIVHDDEDVVRWNTLGNLAMEMNRLNLARCAFERLVEMRPLCPLFLDKLCEVTYGIGDFDACRSSVNMLLAVVPAHPRGLVFKGLLLCQHPSTEEEGCDLLDEAQTLEGALSSQEVEVLRNFERKRPRRQHVPRELPRSIALAKPSWTCLLANLLGAVSVDPLPPSPQQLPSSASLVAGFPSDASSNPLCVLSVLEAASEHPINAKSGAADGEPAGEGAPNSSLCSRDVVEDDATRDCDEEDFATGRDGKGDENDESGGANEQCEAQHAESDARCSVCDGDDDPGDHPGDYLLLCENYDRCGQSCHTTCLSQPLKMIPDGEWLCVKCDPQGHSAGHVPHADGAPEAAGANLSLLPGPGCENSMDSAAEGEGNRDAAEVSPNKRGGGRRSRTANPSANPAPSRKSRRQSQVDTEKRSPIVVQLARILELVEGPGADEGEDDEPVTVQAWPDVVPMVHTGLEGKGETLSRYDMLQRLAAIGTVAVADECQVRLLLDKISTQPVCLLEVVHKLVHALARTACEVRLRGKMVDDLLDLDQAVRGRLTYSPEASLFFAELNLDRYEAQLKDSKREEKRLSQEEAASQDSAIADEDAMDADEGRPRPAEKSHESFLSAYEAHIRTLWCDRLESWRDQARYFWLLARCASCRQEPWNVLDPLQRCKAVFGAAHSDEATAAAAEILLPSCQLNNCITMSGIERCALGPQQQVRDLILDQQALELDADMNEAQAAAADRQGQDDEMEWQQGVKTIAERIVKTLSPFLIQDAEANNWLVSKPCSADAASYSRTEKHLEQLRNACSELSCCFKQELYILNAMLAQIVGVKNVLSERHDESLYAPIDSRFAGKVEGGPRLGVDPALNIVGAWADRQKDGMNEMKKEDGHVAGMLHQLEVQLARMTCKLGCSREHAQLFHKSLLLFYKVYTYLRPELNHEDKRKLLHIMFEEFLRRNVHGHRSHAFFRTYLNVLHEHRRQLANDNAGQAKRKRPVTTGTAGAETSDGRLEGASSVDRSAGEGEGSVMDVEDEKDGGDNDDDCEDDEIDGVMRELAKCYYAMLGYKLREFRAEYEWVDNIVKSSSDDSASVEGRRGSKAKEDGAVWNPAKLTESLALDMWSFVEALVSPQEMVWGKFHAATHAELKEILKAILEAVKPNAKYFVYKKQVEQYLMPFNDGLPSMADLLPDFAAVLEGLPDTASAPLTAADASVAKKASEQRKLECFKQIFYLIAQCISLSNNEEQLSEKIQFYLFDLHIDPRRKEGWMALADAYEELLQTSQSFGVRYTTMMFHSPEAQRTLCNCLQAYSAVVAVAKDDATATRDARKQLGVMLYLLIQGTRSSEHPYPPTWFAQVCAKAYELFSLARDPEDWTVEYYQGKLARKLAKSQRDDAERELLHRKSLEHFYQASVQNTDSNTSTLCIEPLYKLHATRAKILLEGECSSSTRELLECYSLSKCAARAKQEVGDSKTWDKRNIDVFKDVSKDVSFLAKADKEQCDFEATVKMRVGEEGAAEGLDGAVGWGVLRDCMLGMRVAIIKNHKFASSKTRYRLAWMMDHCGQGQRLYLDIDKEEVRSALSTQVGDLLVPLFFKPDDEGHMNLLPPHVVQVKLSNYHMDSEESQVASFSNLNSFVRCQTKLVKLLATHLRRQKLAEMQALDLLEKLAEFVIKGEKRPQKESGAPPISLKPAILHTMQLLYGAMQEKVLRGLAALQTGEVECGAADFAFRVAGKLRTLLQDRMDVFDYLVVSVEQGLYVDVFCATPVLRPATAPMAEGASSNQRISLSNKWCPLLSLLYQACKLYRKQKFNAPLFETSGDNIGNACMSCSFSIWKNTFGTKKLKLQHQTSSEGGQQPAAAQPSGGLAAALAPAEPGATAAENVAAVAGADLPEQPTGEDASLRELRAHCQSGSDACRSTGELSEVEKVVRDAE